MRESYFTQKEKGKKISSSIYPYFNLFLPKKENNLILPEKEILNSMGESYFTKKEILNYMKESNGS